MSEVLVFPDDPADRLGVFKSFGNTPAEYRLETYQNEYDGRDVWAEYVQASGISDLSTDRREKAERAGKRWKEFMDGRERHYSLARPQDAEEWADCLLEQFAIRTAYQQWFSIERFFRWLAWHTDHVHTYNPFIMAAAESPASRELWRFMKEEM